MILVLLLLYDAWGLLWIRDAAGTYVYGRMPAGRRAGRQADAASPLTHTQRTYTAVDTGMAAPATITAAVHTSYTYTKVQNKYISTNNRECNIAEKENKSIRLTLTESRATRLPWCQSALCKLYLSWKLYIIRSTKYFIRRRQQSNVNKHNSSSQARVKQATISTSSNIGIYLSCPRNSLK